jgi:hypothetical protein
MRSGPAWFLIRDLEVAENKSMRANPIQVTRAGSSERYVPILDLWELDNDFIRYVLAVPLQYRPIDRFEAK